MAWRIGWEDRIQCPACNAFQEIPNSCPACRTPLDMTDGCRSYGCPLRLGAFFPEMCADCKKTIPVSVWYAHLERVGKARQKAMRPKPIKTRVTRYVEAARMASTWGLDLDASLSRDEVIQSFLKPTQWTHLDTGILMRIAEAAEDLRTILNRMDRRAAKTPPITRPSFLSKHRPRVCPSRPTN